MSSEEARERLLARVVAYAAEEGISGRSLREIARGAGISHRMLLYRFGSREGLLAALVAAVEVQQRSFMTAMAQAAGTEGLRESLTRPWLAELRLGIAVTPGLLLELVAGAGPAEIGAAYRRFVDLLVGPVSP